LTAFSYSLFEIVQEAMVPKHL